MAKFFLTVLEFFVESGGSFVEFGVTDTSIPNKCLSC
jgi:hypothetical protein